MRRAIRVWATLFMMLLFYLSQAQQRTVSGIVLSEENTPLSGVTVTVTNVKRSTVTDAKGNFTITVPAGEKLVFSYVGYETQQVDPAGKNTVTVKLEVKAAGMGEVVVTAYGIDRGRKSLGYSTPTVEGDEVTQTQRNGFFNGLQGRVPGLSINPTNGDPGASAQIVLRGFVSISGDNSPLIVVDGVPIDNSVINQDDLVSEANDANRYTDYSNRGIDLNPADIDSYTILKGPEATALYGNLGASGAIVITTKKAKAGRGSLSYNNSFRFETQVNYPEVQNKYTRGTSGVSNPSSSASFGPAYPDSVHIYDNIKSFFQTGFTQKHNIVFEGGTDKFTYRWSNEFTDNEGTVPNTRFKRFSTRLTGVGQITPALKMTSTFNYINTYNRKANKGAYGYLIGLMQFPSNYDVTDWQDEFGNRKLTWGTIYNEYDNPFWDVNKNLNEDKTNRILANSNLQLKPTHWLTINGILGADISTTTGLSVYHAQSYLGSGSSSNPTGGTISMYERMTRIFNGSLTARAMHEFGKFNNTYIIGATFSDNNYTTNSQWGQNMYDPNFYSINNTLPTTQRNRTHVGRYRNVGFFAQAILGYQELVYLTLSGRMDGASRLMPNNPYFAYPSASLAFNFTDLEEVKNALPWLSYGKLRASYALTGKEPYRWYSTMSTLEPASSTGGGFAYSYYGGNSDLKPETSTNFETGFELQFLKNRLGIDFTVYHLKSSDQIIRPRISYGSGYVLRMMNGGEVVNKGMEIQLKATPVRSKDFNWNLILNYTHNKGTVISIADELPELYESDTWVLNGIRSAVFPGGSTGALGGWKLARNDAGDVLISPSSGLPYTTDATYYIIGDRTPKFNMGLTNNISYKSLNLSFLWDLRVGGDVVNGTEYMNYKLGYSKKTMDRETPRMIEGVLADGLENTAHPTKNNIAVTPYYNSLYYSSSVTGEMFVEKNIKTLRLRDITLSYDLPAGAIKKIRFARSLGVFATLTDVVLFTNYSGMDPESNNNTPGVGGIGGYGIDYGNMGRPLGVNLGVRMKL